MTSEHPLDKMPVAPSAGTTTQQQAILEFLHCRALLPSGARASFEALTGGGSHATQRVRIHADDKRLLHDLVVKIAPPDGPLAPYDVAREADMMQIAASSGAPAPQVVGSVAAPTPGVDPFLVMHFVAGTTPSLTTLADFIAQGSGDFRLQLARSVVRALVKLGSIAAPPGSAGSLPDLYRAQAKSLRDRVRTGITGKLQAPELLTLAADWLIDNYPLAADATPCLFHGDFRIGNLVFGNSGVRAILDWERAAAGHPLHDIGYFCLPGTKRGPLISGLMTPDELQQLWLDESGTPLNVAACSYFRIFSMFSEYCMMLKAIVSSADSGDALWGVPLLKLVTRLEIELPRAVRGHMNEQYAL